MTPHVGWLLGTVYNKLGQCPGLGWVGQCPGSWWAGDGVLGRGGWDNVLGRGGRDGVPWYEVAGGAKSAREREKATSVISEGLGACQAPHCLAVR